MASNTFGTSFQVTTFGESHGPAIGAVIDGCPAGIPLTEEHINTALARRAPGKTPFTSPRGEPDRARILSGVFEQTTTGAPIAILIENQDADSSRYDDLRHIFRPGHANSTYLAKYGIFDHRGGGRASARETASRVAAGAVAEAMLRRHGVSIFACLAQVGSHKAAVLDRHCPDQQGMFHQQEFEKMRAHLAQSPLFAPSTEAEDAYIQAILNIKDKQDSIGGAVRFFIQGLPAGLGDPVYHKLSARLAYALMSIPAAKGFEIGQGFASASATGSTFNDGFSTSNSCGTSTIHLATNRAGGVLGGISTGDTIYGNVAFKPTSSIGLPQDTLTTDGEAAVFRLPEGSRHDPCVAVRAVPVVESMCWLTIADAWLMNLSARGTV